MTETESGLIAGMRDHPHSLGHMAALADYWHEQGDPRWEPLTWMVQNGRVGRPGFKSYLYPSDAVEPDMKPAMLTTNWIRRMYTLPFPNDIVEDRLAACAIWRREFTDPDPNGE